MQPLHHLPGSCKTASLWLQTIPGPLIPSAMLNDGHHLNRPTIVSKSSHSPAYAAALTPESWCSQTLGTPYPTSKLDVDEHVCAGNPNRPTILSVSSQSPAYGAALTIRFGSSQAAALQVQRVVLNRVGGVTHSTHFDARQVSNRCSAWLFSLFRVFSTCLQRCLSHASCAWLCRARLRASRAGDTGPPCIWPSGIEVMAAAHLDTKDAQPERLGFVIFWVPPIQPGCRTCGHIPVYRWSPGAASG